MRNIELKYPIAFSYYANDLLNSKMFYSKTSDEFIDELLYWIWKDIDKIKMWEIESNNSETLILYIRNIIHSKIRN